MDFFPTDKLLNTTEYISLGKSKPGPILPKPLMETCFIKIDNNKGAMLIGKKNLTTCLVFAHTY